MQRIMQLHGLKLLPVLLANIFDWNFLIMPLTELMNYFNDQLQTQARTKSLPKTGFYKADNSYWARFGSLILGSEFHSIHALREAKVIGYEAELIVRASTGNLLNINSIFNSLDNHDQIVHLDRLVRTLHSLNYLQQFDGQDYLLSLQVQPRHIVSVNDDHGKAFEIILSDCGLKPDRVLLHTRLLDYSTLKHFNKALGNYKNRGYKIGIRLNEVRSLALLASLGLEPDILFIHYPELEYVLKPPIANAAQAFIAPLELYRAQRILVTADTTVLNRVSSEVDGYLLVPEDVPITLTTFTQFNAP